MQVIEVECKPCAIKSHFKTISTALLLDRFIENPSCISMEGIKILYIGD